MTIIALHDGRVPTGQFYPESIVVGANREECIAALQGQCAYAEDLGASTRSDSYLDDDGGACIKETPLYTLIGGSIR